MKKLVLSGFMACCAIIAEAQSTITVYGIIDAGYIGTNYKGVGTSPTTKQNTGSIGQNAETPSRLGFKGTEDLGGGTSAFFTFETGFNPENATLSTFNNRQSFVGLKQNGLGSAAIGLQYTPAFSAIAVTDPGNTNTMLGSLIYASTPQANGNSGTAPFANSSSSAGTSDAVTVRLGNSMTIKSDTFAGFSGEAMIVSNGSDQTQTTTVTNGTTTITGGKNTNSGWGLRANYAYDKLYLTTAYQSFKNYTSGTLTSPTPALWTTASGGVNTQDNQFYAAATYDFGILKAYVQFINRKAVDSLNSNYYAQRRAEQIGVRGYITPTIEGWASVGNGKITAFGGGSPTANFTGYQLGTNYYLSKRTNLYAIFGATQTSNISLITSPIGSNGYALGIRHTF